MLMMYFPVLLYTEFSELLMIFHVAVFLKITNTITVATLLEIGLKFRAFIALHFMIRYLLYLLFQVYHCWHNFTAPLH